MKKYRAWFLNKDNYIMIYFDENSKNFPLDAPNIKSLMKCIMCVDCTGKEIYEKDILDIGGDKAIVFIGKDNMLKILYNDGRIEPFDEYTASLSRIKGNIFESPMVAFN